MCPRMRPTVHVGQASAPMVEPMMSCRGLWFHCVILASLLASEKHFSCAVTCLPSGCTFESLGCTYNKAWKDLDCMYNDIEGSIYVTNIPSETKRVFSRETPNSLPSMRAHTRTTMPSFYWTLLARPEDAPTNF